MSNIYIGKKDLLGISNVSGMWSMSDLVQMRHYDFIRDASIFYVDYLIVAGGGGAGAAESGGGSYAAGGGGGGGGFIQESNYQLISGRTYTITVGAGGAAGTSPKQNGVQGSNSSISGSSFTTTAYGGGYGGGGSQYSGAGHGGPGGSGGGGGGGDGAVPGGEAVYPGSPYIDAARQGYFGSAAHVFQKTGGGGGGAGTGPASRSTQSASGSNGAYSLISGSNTAYAGGGVGGPGSYPDWNGVAGIGGGGGINSSGTQNTGGGGGGNSGLGGSGIVIIAYKANAQTAIGGTVTSYTDSGNTFWVHTFTSSGQFIV